MGRALLCVQPRDLPRPLARPTCAAAETASWDAGSIAEGSPSRPNAAASLLPETRIIEWQGQSAHDFYEQDDDGAGNAAAINGNFSTLDDIRDRIQHTLTETARTRLALALEELLGAIGDEDLAAAAKTAQELSGFRS